MVFEVITIDSISQSTENFKICNNYFYYLFNAILFPQLIHKPQSKRCKNPKKKIFSSMSILLSSTHDCAICYSTNTRCFQICTATVNFWSNTNE